MGENLLATLAKLRAENQELKTRLRAVSRVPAHHDEHGREVLLAADVLTAIEPLPPADEL